MEWRPYRLKFKHPVQLPVVGELTHREGFLLHDPETGGWGDAAPLPGYSPETLEEVRRDLEQGRGLASSFPSLRFAVECARSGWTALGGTVSVNALWLADQEPLEEVVERIRTWSTPMVKVKPGPDPDPDLWCRLLEHRPDVKLRIDPNRAWTPTELRRYTRALPTTSLEYVEEPFSRMEEYLGLTPELDPPIALDESIREVGVKQVAACPCVHSLVLKPTLMGNHDDRADWLALAAEKDLQVVWSSSIESGVGLWHVARLAAGAAPAGLDTASWLEEDTVSPRPVSGNGQLSLPPHLQVM